jgi:hypothetical protein
MKHLTLSTLIKKRKKLKVIKEAFITMIEEDNKNSAVITKPEKCLEKD